MSLRILALTSVDVQLQRLRQRLPQLPQAYASILCSTVSVLLFNTVFIGFPPFIISPHLQTSTLHTGHIIGCYAKHNHFSMARFNIMAFADFAPMPRVFTHHISNTSDVLILMLRILTRPLTTAKTSFAAAGQNPRRILNHAAVGQDAPCTNPLGWINCQPP